MKKSIKRFTLVTLGLSLGLMTASVLPSNESADLPSQHSQGDLLADLPSQHTIGDSLT